LEKKKREIKTKRRAENSELLAEQARKRLAGKNLVGQSVPREMKPWLDAANAAWNKAYKAKFPSLPLAERWEYRSKERGLALSLLVDYGVADVCRAIEYMIQNWDSIRLRFKKSPPAVPTLGLLKAMHASLVPEASKLAAAFAVKARYDAWALAHKGTFDLPPQDLVREYEAAKKELATIGV
jgi:hypothetical protein